MAIDCVDKVLKLKGPPVYVYHEIVHNKHVVQDFQGRGVTFVDEHFDEVPEGGVVVYSAHGISARPSARPVQVGRQLDRSRRHVPAGHQGPHGGAAVRQAKNNKIIFIGHRDHDEADRHCW